MSDADLVDGDFALALGPLLVRRIESGMNKIESRTDAATIGALMVCVPLLLVELVLAAGFAASHTPSQLFVFLTFCAAVLVDAFFFCRAVGSGRLTARKAFMIVLVALIIGAAMEVLTVLGSAGSRALHTFILSKKRFALFAFVAFVLLQLISRKREKDDSKPQSIQAFVKSHQELVYVGIVAMVVAVTVTARVGAKVPFAFYVFAGVGIVAALVLFARSRLSLELTFFMVGFLSGAMLIYGAPVTTGLSWDDQIHYENAVNASYLIESQLTQTDRSFASEAVLRAQGQPAPTTDAYDTCEIDARVAELDKAYESDLASGNVLVENDTEAVFTMSSVGYTAFAAGLWLGRLLHLGFSSMVILSKLANLAVYCSVVAFAISKAPSKKALFAFVGLLPTSIFLAANFSYDSWLISFVMLGFAYYLRYAWGEAKDFSKRNIALAFAFTYIGLAVKAVYFPIIGILFLVSAERFAAPRGRAKYNAAVVALGLLVLASFALPFLFSVGGDAGDARGGADVNPGGQISFILSNPLGYAKILLTYFCTDYLTPVHSVAYSLNYAYVGSFSNALENKALLLLVGVLPAITMIGFGVTSNDKNSVMHASAISSIWTLFLSLITLVLVATALYIDFTPVGLGTVNGCQYRYILPLITPTLCIALNNRRFVLGARRGYAAIALLIAILFFALCFVCIVIPKYV